MSYLLDTNVLSELVQVRPEPAVIAWFDHVPNDSLYISVLTLGEIRKGVELVSDSRRKEKLRIWLEHTLPDWFEDRVLSVDEAVAEQWGRMLAAAGRPAAAVDSLLAATAQQHSLRIVTRNEQDFSFSGLEVINPWINGRQ